MKLSALGLTALGLPRPTAVLGDEKVEASVTKPLVVSTWRHGLAANEAAWKILNRNGTSLDAVEAGVMLTEADPAVRTVGLGGHPDRDGLVTLDASIMNGNGDCGAVAFLQGIKHPVAVARLVMERTPHVMLVGEGALQFALANGFQTEELLVPASEAEWRQWLEESDYQPRINIENHDTIGMLAIDASGNLSGACTTSGAAYKLHGRVGDSPVIGAALFVDNDVGAACTTGLGEAVMKSLTSFLVVELMRQGNSPATASRLAIERIMAKNPPREFLQVGCLAISRRGEIGAYSIQPGFNYAVHDGSDNSLIEAPCWQE